MSLALFFGVLVGAIMGLTGAGGGILAVPVLCAGFGWTLQQAAPVALLAVAISAAIGTWLAWRGGLVRYRAASLMALAGVPMTALGQFVAHRTPDRLLTGVFSVLLLFVAIRMFAARRAEPAGVDEVERGLPVRAARIDAATGRFIWNRIAFTVFIGIGATTGFVTGLLGVGGGFVMVPLLSRFTKAGMHDIVATSLMVIALVGSGSVLVALLGGAQVPLPQAGAFTAASVVGMLIARRIAVRLDAARVRAGFVALLCCVSVYMMLRALRLA